MTFTKHPKNKIFVKNALQKSCFLAPLCKYLKILTLPPHSIQFKGH
eukprot:UN03913